MRILKWIALTATAVLVVAWLASRWAYLDWIGADLKTQIIIEAGTARGVAFFGQLHLNVFYDTPGFHARLSSQPHWLWWGWEWHYGYDAASSSTWRRFGLPLWAPALLTAFPTGWLWLADYRKRHRRRRGLCTSCGYDRRGLATPTAKCPECGAKGEGKSAGGAFPV